MGLTATSTGHHVSSLPLQWNRRPGDVVVALAGNPNVGKSTLFNTLTGSNQHTGNWPGKTVSSARGTCFYHGRRYVLIDLPGTYSLSAHSPEEEVTRDFLCSGAADLVVVVCDATCLERNLNLALQTMEITSQTLICVNLMDEAKRKGLSLDLPRLEQRLHVPVVGISAGRKRGLDALLEAMEQVALQRGARNPVSVLYPPPLEAALACLAPVIPNNRALAASSRFCALRLLGGDIHPDVFHAPSLSAAVETEKKKLEEAGFANEAFTDAVVSGLVRTAEQLCHGIVTSGQKRHDLRDRQLDRLFTSRRTGIPIMILLLAGILWLTITGANIPSVWLARLLSWIQSQCALGLSLLGLPGWLQSILVDGAMQVLFWVVSVMLPPMAIFFPLFTLLEDFGYLPRVAFNLDHAFQKAKTCGKQALTMCMGFGCNAAGVIGCRIIDSPRERLIAMLTNNFVPCNGRFPTLITMITLFFVGTAAPFGPVWAALLLTAILVFGIFMTFVSSRLLSSTLLRGAPSSFTLELPPYRVPRIGQVLIRSILDRTVFVLGRAAAVALPAGILIWIFANVPVGSGTLLSVCTAFLDPFARLLGLDGVIFMAFLLGFPANEIVLPIILMAYLSSGTLLEAGHLSSLHTLLTAHGWTVHTAVCTMLFSLMHWPCSTTCITICKESRSLRWTAVAVCLPTAFGMAACFLYTACVRLLGFG